MNAPDASRPPMVRDAWIDKPGIIGARWWQDSIADPATRRDALKAMLIAGGVLTGAAVAGALIKHALDGDPEVRIEARDALEMQREFGWDFGASGESLTFNGESFEPFDRSRLARMTAELAPASPRYRPFYVPTIFESPAADRRSVPAGDPTAFVPLRDVLKPLATPAMSVAFAQGETLARWVRETNHRDFAVICDLAGPDAVALAAGAASAFDPVFAVDNWPHPRGVVLAHLTLAAAAHYQPLFAKAAASKPKEAPPLFVLDRARLSPYTDDAAQFDNRHLARLPTGGKLVALGYRRVIYIGPDETSAELDDLADELADYRASGVEIRRLGVTDGALFAPGSDPGALRRLSAIGSVYAPAPRTNLYASGPRLGLMPVVLAAGTGAVLGARMSRSGSWNRTSGWGGG